METKTAPLPVLSGYIPQALRARKSWVVWRMVERDGRGTKIPFDACTTRAASSSDPETWSTFTDALGVYSANDDFDGIGIMLAGGDVSCIDLDHCIIDGIIEPWAAEIVAKVDSYTETSQSGDGLHIFVIGTPPAGRRRKGTVEMYGPNDNRYIAITGQRLILNDTSSTTLRRVDLDALHAELFPQHEPVTAKGIESETERSTPAMSDDAIVELALAARNAAKFSALWNLGPDADGYTSPSEARYGLVSLLTFWTQDPEQIARMCAAAGFDRDGDERKLINHDIPNALASGGEHYSPPSGGVIKHSGLTDEERDARDAAQADTPVAIVQGSGVTFPFDALPRQLTALAVDGGAASGCVPEAVAAHGLSVLGAAIGNSAVLTIGNWKQRAVVWTAVIARPGTAKSTALRLAKSPLEALDVAAVDAWRDRKAADKTVPDPKRTLADDTTAEKLARLLDTNPRGILVAADELSGVVSGMNQYKGGKGNDRQLYLKLWSGDALRVDRVGSDSIFVPHPVCTVTGTIQPDLADALRGSDGMTGRWLTAHLEDRKRTHPTDANIERVTMAWAALVHTLHDRAGPLECSLSAAAYDAFRTWRDATIDRANDEENAERADYLGKLESHAARLILLLHIAGDPNGMRGTSIEPETVARALRVLAWFVDGALEHMATGVVDPTIPAYERGLDVAVDKAREWFKRHPGKTWRDAQRAAIAGCRTGDAIKALRARYEAIYPAS